MDPPRPTWGNECPACNGKGDRHDPNLCCISCRNYTAIDESAKRFSLKYVMDYKKPMPDNPEASAMSKSLRDVFQARINDITLCQSEKKAAEKEEEQARLGSDKANLAYTEARNDYARFH